VTDRASLVSLTFHTPVEPTIERATNDIEAFVTEADAVARTETPATVSSLAADLARLGVMQDMVLLVHSSLRAIGWVAGHAHAVVLALQEAVGPGGTLVMPAHSTNLSDPAQWQNPPVPESWWETIRTETPAYDPELTPTREMGAIAECFRKQRGIRRSANPHFSFAARGPLAEEITDDHETAFGLGERSPLARIYELDGHVLLLGVGHESNTSIHLAEYRADFISKKTTTNGAPVAVDGVRRWIEFEDIDLDATDFTRVGGDFEADTDAVTVGTIGVAEARLMRQRALVDYAIEWMARNR
jgi:aminoglycoside 3-N-acetyltransferase